MEMTSSKDALQEMVDSVGFWWHSIDLGQGVVTDGRNSAESLSCQLKNLAIPDLIGKTVLDIGAWDGFYSFEAERRGAERVVALDHYVWSVDRPNYIQYYAECKQLGVVPALAFDTPHWHPDMLPGKRGYDIAHAALNSKVETVVGDFMAIDLAALGTFDVVLFLGVLYHMSDPIESLRRVASLARSLAIIETHAIVVPGYEHLELCEFYSATQLGQDSSNWWGPNMKALEGLCLAAGFSRVDVKQNCPETDSEGLQHFRAIVHAWK